MRLVEKIFFSISVLLIVYSIYLISLHLFLGGLMFHTDIARDFLLLDELVTTKNPTLIGPKSGGIPGMFFGPIWLYAHIPLYLIGNGNPVVLAYFWVGLVLLSIASVGYITYRLFGKISAVVAVLIYAFSSVTFSSGFTQSFGSVLFLPWVIYWMYLFQTTLRQRYLLLALLGNGFVYQFQPAVGMITLPVTVIISAYLIIKKKKIRYFLNYAVLLVPFSTYILFDIRHDFLQTRAFISHFLEPHGPNDEKLTFLEFVINRKDSYAAILDLGRKGISSLILFIGLYGYLFYRFYRKYTRIGRDFYLLCLSYIIGFIIVTLLYKGIIIDYYYWAFLPVSIISFAGLYRHIHKLLFFGIAILILLQVIQSAVAYRDWWVMRFTGKEASSWRLNREVAKFIFADAPQEFGYFVYSPDEFGHSAIYAMNYTTKETPNQAKLCEKKQITYLIYFPTPLYAKTDPTFWKNVRVSIQKEPIMKKQLHQIRIEKYELTEQELAVMADPNIVCNLHFR